MNFILGLVIVVGGWYLIKSFANAQPAKARGLIRKIGGVAVMAFGAFMMVKGEINVAIPMFMLGLGLMGQQAMFPNGMPWQRKTPGQASKVSTSIIAMQLDHDTGRMEGEVLSGAYKGRKLSSLTLPEAQALHAQCAAAPDQSRALFESWIERTHPEWRAAWNSGAGRAAATTSQKMTRGEALAILGIKEGATEDDIRAAHRRLMKTAHPDLGGSDYLAAKINEAKEYLLQKS
ncbi:MAG: molecular chaperone DnaJ [Alphaproteobacteria bacterium]|nr:molecular chaperone DnaJ [Alphaproteobacteria bacterium]